MLFSSSAVPAVISKHALTTPAVLALATVNGDSTVANAKTAYENHGLFEP